MDVLNARTKAKLGWKTAKAGAKRPNALRATVPPAVRLTFKTGKPLAKRRARQQAQRIGETARTVGETARTLGETAWMLGETLRHVPQAAQELGLAEAPPPKRTAPRVAAGVVIGASAVYFLEPGVGAEHRRQVLRLVS
jgi:hypothetical protein